MPPDHNDATLLCCLCLVLLLIAVACLGVVLWVLGL